MTEFSKNNAAPTTNATNKMLGYLSNNRGGADDNKGIYSVCSAHPFVIEAACVTAKSDGSTVAIEATCNQVNQEGGYTGMRPQDFVDLVYGIANKVGLPWEQVVLGGDHLGPAPWYKKGTAAEAMDKACAMVEEYVAAGFRKLHLDASFLCKDDQRNLPKDKWEQLVAARAAQMCHVAEQAYTACGRVGPKPNYIIGTEVPVPGGATGVSHEMQVTSPANLDLTINTAKDAFRQLQLNDAWERVIGVVVQPGVEFGTVSGRDFTDQYDAKKARKLSQAIQNLNVTEGIVGEAHSSDFQSKQNLSNLVVDGFAILKVGPWLTHVMRHALYNLERIEKQLVPAGEQSYLSDTLERVMVDSPGYWQGTYQSDSLTERVLRHTSISDRIRYYMAKLEVQQAVSKLCTNLERYPGGIPANLIYEYMPLQFDLSQAHPKKASPRGMVINTICQVLEHYGEACGHRRATKV
jgi:D-tagatose-1,6-bisphosphate aldolase subunit GatZ/KbaZ